MPSIEERAAAIVDGIYFGLPAEVYHAVPRLSASAIQKLLVSPATFWRGSWLDPDRPEPDEEATKAQILGKAYHTARLEPELFDKLYVRQLEKADMPKGSLLNASDIERELAERGEAMTKKGETVLEKAMRLVNAGWTGDGLIWHIALDQWEEARADRQPIPAKFFDDIRRDMDRIRSVADVAALLHDGAAEVSIFWTDDRGNKCKARLDYLQAVAWSDFKTFDNSRGKPLPMTIADAFRFNRYHVQAAHYRDAVEAVRSGAVTVIEGTAEQRELIDALILTEADPACWYIFIEKNGVPNLLAKRVRFYEVPISTIVNDAGASEEGIERMHALTRQPSIFYVRAMREIRKAKRLFRAYSEVYQPGEPWLPFDPLGEITDMDFSSNWLDEDIGE